MTIEDELRAQIREELKASRRAGRALADACASGNLEHFEQAVEAMELAIDGWRHAALRIARLPSVTPQIRQAFIDVWIQHKHLPLAVGHRPTMVRALRVLLAGVVQEHRPLTLYRGAGAHERRRRLYGFSWSTDKSIARDRFAEAQRRADGGAVLLRTIAPPEAVLLRRDPIDFYDEGEVIVDPFLLGRVELVERLSNA